MSIDRFFGLKYDKRTYNCYHFSCDVWMHLTGEDLSKIIDSQMQTSGRLYRRYVRQFREIKTPVSPCLVIMQNPNEVAHMGVFYNGRILHFSEQLGTEYMPPEIACRLHTKVRYATRNHS